MENNFYISSSFLNKFVSIVQSRGGDASMLLQRVSLVDPALEDSNRLIPLDCFIELLELSARQLNFPNISLCLAKKQDITFLGPLSLILYQCDTMSKVMETVTQYFKIAVSGVDIKFEKMADSVALRFNCNVPYISNSHQYQDYVLASAANTIWELLGRKYNFRGCFFTRQEQNEARIDEYTKYFGCPVAFGSDAIGLTLDNRVLDEPSPAINQYISQKINMLLSTRKAIVDQVTQVVGYCLASGHADIDSVAKVMGYSRRTLQRRLKEASTSFSDILESIRLSQAEQYLFHTTYRLTDIAKLLGYNNLSSFTRSYKRWHNIEPQKARENFRSELYS